MFRTTAMCLTQSERNKPDMSEREILMENVRRYRALASLCRQQAAYRPLQSWDLLGQAEHFEHLAETELKAHFDACNAHRADDEAAAAQWEAGVAA